MTGRGKQRAVRFKCTASFEVSVWAPLEEGQSRVSGLCFVFLGLLAFFHSKYVYCSLPAFSVISSYLYGFFPHLRWCAILGFFVGDSSSTRCPAELPKMCSWFPLFSCLTMPILYLYTPSTKDINMAPTYSCFSFCRLFITLDNYRVCYQQFS